MPFRKRRGVKRTMRRRRRPLRAAAVRQVKRIVQSQAELKYLNIIQPQLGVSTTAAIGQLMNISQGDLDNERNGDKIRLTGKLYMRFFVDGSDIYNFVRFIVFQWHPMNSAHPTAGDILLNGSSSSVDYTSHYNHDKRTQFSIIFDKTFKTVGDGASGSPYQDSFRQSLMRVLRIPRKNIFYNTTSSTIGTNQLYYLAVSDSTTINHPGIFWTMKLPFTDI